MELGLNFWLELAVLLACLFYAAPKGGMTLGLMGGIGLIIFVFGFGLKPGKPPVDVILTIMAVVCASSALQAAGGLDCLLQIAERVLRNHPRAVCYLAPYLCWMLTVLCGTGHTVYTMLPIIYDVAIKNGIRPERPMAASTIAAQMGVICSPAAVACVSMVALMDGQLVGGKPFSLVTLLSITIPAALVGLFAVGTFSVFRGKDLDKDEKFQALIADPEQKKYVYGETTTLLGVKFNQKQWGSLWIFLATVAIVAVLGSTPELRPLVGKKRLSMTLVIQMFMLLAGILMVMFCDAKKINKTSVFNAGMVAIVSVYGVAWMSDTMFSNHIGQLKVGLTEWVKAAPWTFGIVLLLVSKLVNSQAAAVAIVVPVAIQIGTPAGIICAMASACYGYYILPTYPSDLAALTFDRSGTTHIGKFVINHSFILPGLIGVFTAVAVGWVLGMFYGYI
jgi:anaerobic C4-dicarboxylate transporter DcuB